MGEETLGPGQRLLRLAWFYTHRVSPMFDLEKNPNNIFKDWEVAIASIVEDDSDEQGYDVPMDVVHSNVRAMMIDRILPLAKAADYNLGS